MRAAAEYGTLGPSSDPSLQEDSNRSVMGKPEIRGLLLETPFTSVKDMLATIYPQRWLPYRYLWPFLRSHWDSRQALGQIAGLGTKPQVLIMQAGKDELVPQSHGEELEKLFEGRQMEVKRLVVPGALHHEILFKAQGKTAVADFLKSVGEHG